jgi:3-methyladenine DNA glycosylase/8-oxoguanine DNA glycosylase
MAFTIRVPEDFDLARDYCSYGYFLLRPNHWDVHRRVFTRDFSIDRVPIRVEVSQKGAGEGLLVTSSRGLSAKNRAKVEVWLTRMLRLDEPASVIGEFHRLDPRWKKSGRGRLMRSATMFEDVIKTVTSCNVTWPSTVQMNRRLCEVLGGGKVKVGIHPFPEMGKVSGARAQTLRARCRVGYRDARIVELARMFKRGEVKPAWFEDPTTPDEAVYGALLELPGIGPYAAANIMQLLGRYGRLPLDTESVRHGTMVLGYSGTSAEVMKRVRSHYEPFKAHAFRSYWFELWAFYESKYGPSWTWERDSTGAMFTAANLSKQSRAEGSPLKR